MKKIIVITISILLMALTACADPVSRTPIDARYTPAHEEIQTSYNYRFDPFGESTFKLMPNVHTEYVADLYEVLYEVKYDDGYVQQVWEPVDYATYKRACESMGKDGAE